MYFIIFLYLCQCLCLFCYTWLQDKFAIADNKNEIEELNGQIETYWIAKNLFTWHTSWLVIAGKAEMKFIDDGSV